MYRDAVKEIVRDAIADGFEGVVLVGESDLAFIVEHECCKLDVPFKNVGVGDEKLTGKWFYFFSEVVEPKVAEERGCYSLNRLVMG